MAVKISNEILQKQGIVVNEKYPYDQIKRVTTEGRRHYATPDGRSVPSVTTILSATKDMTHLNAWKKRIGETEAQRIATESANIGTVMHRSLEKHVLGQDRTPGSNIIQQKAHAMANVIIEHGLKDVNEVWGSEINLYYPELYAGTTDLVGELNGVPHIFDFKQARKLKKSEWIDDYRLQLVAYAEAHNKLFGTDIRSGRIFICTQNNEYQTFEIDDYDKWCDQWYRRVEQYYKSVL
jgi:hypothetical protein